MRPPLERILNGETLRVMNFTQPQVGKSTQNTVHLAARFLDKFPEKRVQIYCNEKRLVNRFSREIKNLYLKKHSLPKSASKAIAFWETGDGGSLYTATVGSGGTGAPADLIIIDDPIKGVTDCTPCKREYQWDWWSTVPMARAHDNVSVVFTMTPWHADALDARILAAEKKDWIVIKLPALAGDNDPLGRKKDEPLWAERWGYERLIQQRSLNPHYFQALFQCEPVLDGGNIIKEEYLQNFYIEAPRFHYIIQSIDTNCKEGTTSDYTTITTWGVRDTNVYLLDCWRKQCGYVELENMVISKYEAFKPSYVLIEETSNGYSLIDRLKKFTMVPIKPIKPRGSKTMRLEVCVPLFANGKVFLPEKAPWLYDYIQELLKFPSGDNDDQVDSTSQGLSFIQNRASTSYKNLCN
jgi:predicted phage terminase large subunit-like protein